MCVRVCVGGWVGGCACVGGFVCGWVVVCVCVCVCVLYGCARRIGHLPNEFHTVYSKISSGDGSVGRTMLVRPPGQC